MVATSAASPYNSASEAFDIEDLNERHGQATTEEILEWAWGALGPDVAASSSFQTQSVPLLHIISRACPQMPILFLDTGFHFKDTLAFRDTLRDRLNLNIVEVHAAMSKKELFARYGHAPYESNPELCCYIHKVEPMRRVMENYRGWVSGVRHDQTKGRQGLQPLVQQHDGVLKIHPMLRWTKQEVQDYIKKHDLPEHPLDKCGYASIGCSPCTHPVTASEDDRSGRWRDKEKTECGLHYEI